MSRALVNVPSLARRGQIIEIKVLMSHPMESGYRVGMNGTVIPRNIIQLFTCSYNGVEVFRAVFSPAIAANPFLQFHTIATESGTLVFHWSGDDGFDATEHATIVVA
jgi:sulfur-oxidizing protein SoxZ